MIHGGGEEDGHAQDRLDDNGGLPGRHHREDGAGLKPRGEDVVVVAGRAEDGDTRSGDGVHRGVGQAVPDFM